MNADRLATLRNEHAEAAADYLGYVAARDNAKPYTDGWRTSARNAIESAKRRDTLALVLAGVTP